MISSYVVEHAQKDGRRWVNETHRDGQGVDHLYSYLSDDKMDRDAILSVHAAQITEALAAMDARDQEKLALDAKLQVVLEGAKTNGQLTADEIAKLGLAPEAVAK